MTMRRARVSERRRVGRGVAEGEEGVSPHGTCAQRIWRQYASQGQILALALSRSPASEEPASDRAQLVRIPEPLTKTAFAVDVVQFRLGELRFSSFHLYQECQFKTFYDIYNILPVKWLILGSKSNSQDVF